MSQIHKHDIPANIAERCLINPEQYEAKYQQSVTDPDAFWGEQGKILDWITPYTKVKNTSFAPRKCVHQMVRRRHAKPCRQLHWTAISLSVATKPRLFGKAMTQARAKP